MPTMAKYEMGAMAYPKSEKYDLGGHLPKYELEMQKFDLSGCMPKFEPKFEAKYEPNLSMQPVQQTSPISLTTGGIVQNSA